MSYVQDLAKLVEVRKDETLRISDAVWGYAESRFQEFKSAKEESDYMIEMGFKVTMGIGGEETRMNLNIHEDECDCGHEHHHDCDCGCEHEHEHDHDCHCGHHH